MCKQIIWCYVFVLTLLEISLNTKLSAQGKSHGAVHEPLVSEGLTFQEWGASGTAAPAGGGGSGAGAVRAWPPTLAFGSVALGAAHARTVTLTNEANTTVHLASVAGTTHDFHASFFESKTLPPAGNTTFSVVYVGRREGPVAAQLYIHTSLGVHEYPVSATGRRSAWGAWPLSARVPPNATLTPTLSIHNPTDSPVQIREVYSSAAWLGLELPDGAASAPESLWTLPPHSARPLVRLRIAPAPADRTAYIRIKANVSFSVAEEGAGDAPLVIGVEVRGAEADGEGEEGEGGGVFAQPLQLRAGVRGTLDPPHTWQISLGNASPRAARLSARASPPRCRALPFAADAAPLDDDEPPPHTGNNGASEPNSNGGADPLSNGARGGGAGDGGAGDVPGVAVAVSRTSLPPHEPLAVAATVTMDWQQLWASHVSRGAGGAVGALCSGWLRLGGARVPYSVTLLPGRLRLEPQNLHFITTDEGSLAPRWLHLHNEFATPARATHFTMDESTQDYFIVKSLLPLVIPAHGSVRALSLQLRDPAALPARTAHVWLRAHCNVSDAAATAGVSLHTGALLLEWEWPRVSADGVVDLGHVTVSSTTVVRFTVRNPGAAPLCITGLRAQLEGAALVYVPCGAPRGDDCWCVAGYGAGAGWVTVVGPARETALSGSVLLQTAHAATEARLTLVALRGRVAAEPLRLRDCAPSARCSGALRVASSMARRMAVLAVRAQPEGGAAQAIAHKPPAPPAPWEISPGDNVLGEVSLAAEELCAPRCYTGLAVHTPEGAAWLARGTAAAADGRMLRALQADAALLQRRAALFAAARLHYNATLAVSTEQVVQITVPVSAQLVWPRLTARAGGGGAAPVAGVGGAPLALPVTLRNPSLSHSLLLQPVLADSVEVPAIAGGEPSHLCSTQQCEYSALAFNITAWRALSGSAALHPLAADAPGDAAGEGTRPLLLLSPGAELELTVTFAPKEPKAMHTYLYLRNNLTILEVAQLSGLGALPAFELAGRSAQRNHPILIEVTECGHKQVSTVRRSLVARNTGRVPLTVRAVRVGGAGGAPPGAGEAPPAAAAPCQARGFSVECAPFSLGANDSRTLQLAFTPDWTLGRVHALITLYTDLGPAEFSVVGVVPAALAPACAAAAGGAGGARWEGAVRPLCAVLAVLMLAMLLAIAALEAEATLKRALAALHRPAPPLAHQRLDLRALNHAAPPAPAPHPPAAAAPAHGASMHAAPRTKRKLKKPVCAEAARRSDSPSPPAAPAPSPPAPAPAPLSPAGWLSALALPRAALSSHAQDDDVTPDDTPLIDDESGSSADDIEIMDCSPMEVEDALSPSPPPRAGSPEGRGVEAERGAGERERGPRAELAEPRDEEDNVSTGTESSHSSSRDRCDSPAGAPPAPRASPAASEAGAGGGAARGGRRRELATPTRRDDVPRHKAPAAKFHKKEKLPKRKPREPADTSRFTGTPAGATATPSHGAGGGAGGGVRWGTTFSEVVARSEALYESAARPAPPPAPAPPVAPLAAPRPLAPIGSDVPKSSGVRRSPESFRAAAAAGGDHSLFYFNGDCALPSARDERPWREPAAYSDSVAASYTEDNSGVDYSSLSGSLWSSGGASGAGAWLWGGAAGTVRPPPGFAAPPPPPARAFDPFHALAAIWAPGGSPAWSEPAAAPPAGPPAGPPAAPHDDPHRH